VRLFLIHVRYWGAFIICMVGVALTLPGEAVIKLGRWIGSRG
jgi:hypothetical protein